MSAKSRPSDAPNATRQMLDELDALMERMLSLPVNDLAQPAPAAPRPSDRPALSAKLTVVEAGPSPAPTSEEASCESRKILVGRLTAPSYTTPLDESVQPSDSPASSDSLPSSIQESWQQQPDLSGPEQVASPNFPVSSTSVSPPLRRRRSLTNRLMQPLLWINRRYDRFTQELGPAGRWLRSAHGRMVLGYLGLTLLGVAIAWSVRDWLSSWW